ncbi:lytic transglycosylase domain-containing protein [Rubellimicrobium sp. CFH 75288]|uniref:lytic transglycosylase domain-containing protein n=1 Tax=Rubellimicrobium sp. CFH 75288 TaxID=2697034 RepID=UPI001412180D|nr:lytic transglycosylase domain-containing protein [Rubellimicrobium sp. CFH 75288]NAZ37662.1 transglycosylase SLT domain-containing protein [Rubellimicrobium sp. CFH 75288]
MPSSDRFAAACRRLAALIVVALAAWGAAPPASAEQPAVAALREAVRLADRGQWEAAARAAERGGPVVEAIIQWRHLRDGAGTAEFAEYATFLRRHPDWPGLDRLRANGETAIRDAAPPEAVIAYFGDALPTTGMGAVALARALEAQGRAGDARAMLREVWLTQPLNESGQARLLAAYGDVLAPHHAARADAMLWRWRTADAERMIPLLPDERRALVRARVALIRQQGAAADRIAALPAGLRDHPGLAYDRFARIAEEGRWSEAASILLARSGSTAALGEPARWASWRAQTARWAMRQGRYEDAYRIASRHFLSEPSESHADLEWIAGFLSLRFLDEPARALEHFRRSEAQVTGPISTARAAYWQGRAEEALGLADDAAISYARAATNQTAFYGLLAAEKLGLTLDPSLTGLEDFGDWRSSGILAGELGQAMLMLLAAGERSDAILFARALARSLDRQGIGQLANLLEEMHEAHIAVLVGKTAAERGIIVPAAYFPLHPMAWRDWPVSGELALAIARRESEFSPAVTSPVGAQGLMQLMPGTAREVAGWLGLSHSPARLNDWEYNARLGTRYLQMLEGMFGPSPVLVAAGYNAGPGRPRQWMAERGDIRREDVDVIDWIEMIPFAETRIYVMRVTESLPVYRARLTGETGPVEFTRLLRGEPPRIRPATRPRLVDASTLVAQDRLSASNVSAEIDEAVAGAVARELAEEVARQTAVPGLRPVPRPVAAPPG